MQLTNLLLVLSLSTSGLSAHIGRRQSNDSTITVTPNPSNTTASNQNTTTIIINDNQTSSNPLDIQCASFQKLTALAVLSTNATLLQSISQSSNLSAAQIAELQASSQNATSKLAAIQAANSTLAGTCANSVRVSRACAQLTGLTSLDTVTSDPAKLAALQQQQNLTQAQVAELQAAAVNSKPILQALQSNQTLVNECNRFIAERGSGQGVADAAAAAVASVSGGSNSSNGTTGTNGGSANAANGTTTTIDGAAAATGTGTPVSATAGAQTSPISANGAGSLEFGYGFMGTALFVTMGMVMLG